MHQISGLPNRLRAALRGSPRREFLAALAIAKAERPRRLTSVAAALIVTDYAVGPKATLWIAAAICLNEIAYLAFERFNPDWRDAWPAGDEEPRRLVSTAATSTLILFWAITAVGACIYYVPAVLLAGGTSVPMKLTGLLWSFTVMAHVANTYTRLPLFLWCQLLPGYGSVAVLLVSAHYGILSVSWKEWTIAAGILSLYYVVSGSSILTLARTHAVLRAMTKAADSRLARLEYLHRHDGLTGLLTRQAFDTDLASLLATRTPRHEVVVLTIDLDGFKPINDSYSHAAGDTVLAAIADRLREFAPGGALIARLGGDEYAMAYETSRIGPELESGSLRLLASIESPIDHEGRALRVGASIGIAASSAALMTVAQLCRAADQAMLLCKSTPGLRICRYGPDTVAHRPTLQDRLRIQHALANGEIAPHYQPKVRLKSGEICGFEALARWIQPDGSIITPHEFIPMINELGLQGDFLTAIADTAMRDLSALLDLGFDPGQFSINVPEVTLATFTGRNDLDRLLDKYPQALPHLTFEITEDVFISRSGSLIQASIVHFRNRGVRIALDDFGTGFASFQHLRELEFDELKIDCSFVAGLGKDTASDVLVDGFLSIATGLGVAVVAEGVETETQRQHLLAMGARVAQGWLFARAMPFDDIVAALRREAEHQEKS